MSYFFLNRIKRSFIALSMTSLLCPSVSSAVEGPIDNNSDPNKQVTVGNVLQGDTLSGSITTSGNNVHTTVNFRGDSKMENGQISAVFKNQNGATENADTKTGATNTIILQENSVLNLTANANQAGNNGPDTVTTDPAYSILASGSGAQNTISDITTGTAKGAIAGAIFAKDGGINLINNLRNTAISGAVIAEGKGSTNTLSFDQGTNLTGYIATLKGGVNTLTLSEGATLNLAKEATEGASILANGISEAKETKDDIPSINTIKGTTKEKNTISGAIVAKDKGINNIDIYNLEVLGDIKAVNTGSNTLALEKGFLTNISTTGEDSKNSINLNGDASIKGAISNLETTGTANKTNNGINTITLNDNSTLNLNKGSNTSGAAIFSSNGSNTIGGNSIGAHKITGNITATKSGKNTITLQSLTMTGDITTDESGINTITLGSFNATEKSTIIGDIKAKNKGQNTLHFTNVTLTGNIFAGDSNDVKEVAGGGYNEITLLDSSVSGNISAQNNGNNRLVLGNGGTKATVIGSIKAQKNGSNVIEFNNGEVNGGIFAEGEKATNTITLGNQTYTGIIKSNITATNNGTNTISIQSVNMTGSITAKNQGKNTITDNNPFDTQSTITGGIIAQDNGKNTATLKNIALSAGITAGGNGATNTIIIGGQENGVVSSDITANAQGANDISFDNHTSLVGNILANANGTNTIKEKTREDGTISTTTQSLLTGSITADKGNNTITLANTKITKGIIAKNAGQNTVEIKTTESNYKLITNITAESGGMNTITIGENDTKTGILEGSLNASGNGSQNTLSLNKDSSFINGSITADATTNSNDQTATNNITLNHSSLIHLKTEGYALYATGINASNTITGNNNTGKNIIEGDIVADGGENTIDENKRALNTIKLDNLTIKGEINAYNAATNTLELKTANITGNFLAQDSGKNVVKFKENSEVTVSGSFVARTKGTNTLTLNNDANINITSNNNPNAFQAVEEGAINSFTEINTTNNNTSGTITGHIYAQNKGSNLIQVQKLTIIGNIISYNGINTITLGADTKSSIQGNVIADSSNGIGNTESKNTITLDKSASLEGYIMANGTNIERVARNEIILGTNSKSALNLNGGTIADSDGNPIGTENDAIFSETIQAYNLITDNSTGETQSVISGNIYAKDNTQDTSQKGGNDITIKNITMEGNILADSNGINKIIFGMENKASNIKGNILAQDGGSNNLVLKQLELNSDQGVIQAMGKTTSIKTSNTISLNNSSSIINTSLTATQESLTQQLTIQETVNSITINSKSYIALTGNPLNENNAIAAIGYKAKNEITDYVDGDVITANTIAGNIFAGNMGVNNLNFNTLKINEDSSGGIIAKSNMDNANETKNRLIIRDNSLIKNTYILANQEAQKGDLGTILQTRNEISLYGSAVVHLTANPEDENAIAAIGVHARNSIEDNGKGSHTITGNIVGNYDGQNDISLNQVVMIGDVTANNTGQNILRFGSATNNTNSNGSFYGNISAITNFGASRNTFYFRGIAIGGEEAKSIFADSKSTNGGFNTLNLYNNSSLSNMYMIAQGQNSINTIDLMDTASKISLTSDPKTGFVAYATGNGSANIIQGDNNTASHTITGGIQAEDSGRNDFKLYQLTLSGDVIAKSLGSNTLTFGNTTNASTFTGNITAEDGNNAITITKTNLGTDILGTNIQSNATINNSSNTLTLKDASILQGQFIKALSKTTSNEENNQVSFSSVNALNLEGTSYLVLRSQDDVILASGNGAKNTITDTTSRNAKENNIAGNIQANNSGVNDITLKRIIMQGDILAKNSGSNTINFGNNENGNQFIGNLIVSNASNTVTLQHTAMTGYLQALINNSKNTLVLTNSTITDGYMVAISTQNMDDANGNEGENPVAGAINSLSIDTDSTIAFKGVQIVNANGEKVGSGNDAIFTQGAPSQNLITDNSSNTHTIVGNITADSGGKNNYEFGHINITGSIYSTTHKAGNTIKLKNSSTLKEGVIMTRGNDVANTLTFTDNASLTQSYLQAILENNNAGTPDDEGVTTQLTAKNTLIFEGNSTFGLIGESNHIAILADGDGASNIISGNKGNVNGDIFAKNGGINTLTEVRHLTINTKNIKAIGNNAKNNIKITNENVARNNDSNSLFLNAEADGIAVLADNGSNRIELILGSHNITGDIFANNAGNNTLSYSGNTTAGTNNGITITGNIYASTQSSNNLTLQNAMVISNIIKATDGSKNTIALKDKNSIATGSIKLGNADTIRKDVLIADGYDSKNTISSTSNEESIITGNIIAQSAGSNILTDIAKFKMTNGYIIANGDGSSNNLVLNRDSQISLVSSTSKNAIFASGIEAINKIKDNDVKTTPTSIILGNITSQRGGKNELSVINLSITGDLNAYNEGNNTIKLGGGNQVLRQSDGTKNEVGFTGAIFATGADSKNSITFSSGAKASLIKNENSNNAVLASGDDANNTITDNNSGNALKISGDISAIDSGKNTINFDNTTMSGNVIARSGGNNILTFQQGNITETQTIVSSENNSLNTLNYNNFSFSNTTDQKDHFTLNASNAGENRLFLTIKKDANQKNLEDLKLSITTTNQGINTIIAQQVNSAQANISYSGGSTTAVFSQTKSTDDNTGGNINVAAYSDGVMLTLNASKANDIFKDFRDLTLFFSNHTRVYMKDKSNYSFAGNYVGDVNFLKLGTKNDNEINLTLENNASLIASLYSNGNGKINLELNKNTKWIVIPTDGDAVSINKLTTSSSANTRQTTITLNSDQMHQDTLKQGNTLVDLATGGYATKYGVDKTSHTSLSIASAGNLNDVIFRVYADTIHKQSDVVKVNGINNGDTTSKALLQAYYTVESLQNAEKYIYQDNEELSVNNTLVATIETNAKDNFSFDISKPTTVEQGYLLVTTEFIKKTEDKTPLGKNSEQVDNYYIKAYSAAIKPQEAQNTYSLLSANYLVFLSGISDINKRLGEVRDETYNHGLWARTFFGQMSQNQGIAISNNYISAQTGYDFALPTNGGMHFIGFSFGYGAHSLVSDAWKMNSSVLSGSLYYSFVKDSGIYADTVFRYDYIDSKPQAQDITNQLLSHAFSLSEEIGYRAYFDSKQRFFFEAQGQFIGAYMTDLTALQQYSNRTEAKLYSKMSNSYLFRGRVGGIFGYRLKTAKNQTDFRLGASYVADYNMAKIDLEVEKIATDSKNLGFNQMALVSLGINSYLTKSLRLYLEGEIGFLGKTLNQNYAANLGLRYSFGTTKREVSSNSEVDQKIVEDEFETLNIEASQIKCNGCNPESGFYIKLLDLPEPNAGLNNYLNKMNYRIHKQDGKVTYYVGPYKKLDEAKKQQDIATKIKQSLTKNPSTNTDIYKINNKSKR
ncbi:hypothetical protein [Helicobacter sp. 'CLO3_human']|nr:hypothetical protein [Helicobacter sp. 'CLO3_human']